MNRARAESEKWKNLGGVELLVKRLGSTNTSTTKTRIMLQPTIENQYAIPQKSQRSNQTSSSY